MSQHKGSRIKSSVAAQMNASHSGSAEHPAIVGVGVVHSQQRPVDWSVKGVDENDGGVVVELVGEIVVDGWGVLSVWNRLDE